MKALKYLLLVSAVLVTAACGGGGGGGGGGGSAVITTPGTVIDGYVQGAQVYIVPMGELTGAHALYTADAPSDAKGKFVFSSINDFLVANAGKNKYQYVSVGGTNTATGLPITSDTVYEGPLGCKVLSPVTTLVMKTATALANGGPLTQSAIDQAVAQVAAVAGIDAGKANTALLSTDPVANAATDSNASKTLALQLTITQLATQKVVDANGDFANTVSTLATRLATTAPMNVVVLATSAASDADSQAKAQVIASAIMNTVSQVAASASSQSSAAVATNLMAQMESQLATNLQSSISNVTATSDLAAATNQIANDTTSTVISAGINTLDKTTVAANLQDSTVTDYLRRKASEGGIAQLLGIDVMSIPSGSVAVKAMAHGAAKMALARPARLAATASTNPCTSAGNASVTVACSDMFGSDFCASSSGTFQGSVACSNGAPSSVSIQLTGFGNSAFGTTLSGSISMTNSSMTFTNLTNGSTTFNGTVGYSSGVNGSLDVAVKKMTVTSPMWSTLTLDSFSRASIIPATSTSGQDGLTAYISGTGTLASNGAAEDVSLNYERYQDDTKTQLASGYSDGVTVKLNGHVSQGSEVVKFTDFGLNETRYFQGAADQNYQYKLSSFIGGSKISSSKYGYAYFSGDGLKFNYDTTSGSPVYQSGTLSMSTQAPQ